MTGESTEAKIATDEHENQGRNLVIDLHTHFIPRTLPDFSTRYGYSGFVTLETGEANDQFGRLMKGSKTLSSVPSCAWDLNQRLIHMNERGISIQVLSPFPSLFSYWAKADDTADLCRIVNNSISKEIQRFKRTEDSIGRFVGLGIVPMQAPELAIIELERCVKELGFVGVQIGTHVNEWNLDAPELAPFWEACEDLDCCVFVHPWDMEVTRKDRKYWLPHLVGMPHETNRAITTVLLGGVMDKFPKLKLCFSDGGGSFPYIQGRVQQAYHLNPTKVATGCDVSPDKFVGKFFCDSVVGNAKSLELLLHVIGEDKVLYGTNYPFVPGSFPIVDEANLEDVKLATKFAKDGQNLLNEVAGLSEAGKQKVLGLNAVSFLGIDPSRLSKQ